MDNQIKQFEVSSPDELRQALACHEQNGVCFAGVRVFGPNVLTRQFNFPNTSRKDLIAGLKMEASQTLSVAADLEVTYQIIGRDEQGVHGVYSVMPRDLLLEYFQCFKNHPLVPVSLSTSAVSIVIDFLKDHPLPGDNFCLVNFLKSHAVNIIIFTNSQPTFFRELYDLNENDYKDKIKDTIRYSCSHSASKNIEHIYFIGELTGKDELIKSLEGLENQASSEKISKIGDRLDLNGLNLFGNFVCTLAERTKLVLFFSWVSAISILLGLFLVWYMVNGNAKLQTAKFKFNISDYNRALDLQQQVRRMNHE